VQCAAFALGAAPVQNLLLLLSEHRCIFGSVGIEMEPAKSELLSALSVGEQAEVTDFNEAGWQDVEQEAADELDRIEGHDLDAVVMLGVAPAKAHLAVAKIEESAVGDGDTMGVAGQILQDMLGTAEGWLGADHPRLVAQQKQQGVERLVTRTAACGTAPVASLIVLWSVDSVN
jgi:hypothetical protein